MQGLNITDDVVADSFKMALTQGLTLIENVVADSFLPGRPGYD